MKGRYLAVKRNGSDDEENGLIGSIAASIIPLHLLPACVRVGEVAYLGHSCLGKLSLLVPTLYGALVALVRAVFAYFYIYFGSCITMIGYDSLDTLGRGDGIHACKIIRDLSRRQNNDIAFFHPCDAHLTLDSRVSRTSLVYPSRGNAPPDQATTTMQSYCTAVHMEMNRSAPA